MYKTYLGDGAYVEVDDETGDIVLTTEDGIRVTNCIVLDTGVWAALELWVRRIFRHHETP